jgi:hypothetical protein
MIQRPMTPTIDMPTVLMRGPASTQVLQRARNLFQASDVRTIVLIVISSVFWIIVVRANSHNNPLALAASALLGALVLLRVASRGVAAGMPVLVYLIAIETVIREYAEGIGYLYVEYLCTGAAVIALFLHRGRFRWPVLLLGLYIVLELIDVTRASDALHYRSVLLRSIGRLAILVLAVRMTLDSRGTEVVIRAFIIGTVTVAALVAFSVFTGNVKWGTMANHSASSGMGPNQVGFMLAFGAFTTFVAADLASTARARSTFFGLTAFQALGAMLTFTRGAVVALAACIIFYALMRPRNRRHNRAHLVVALALLVGTAWTAIQVTDSMLVKRFEKRGISNRDTIAQAGWEIFMDQPLFGAIAGIGTSNFFEETGQRGNLGRGVSTGAHNELVRSLAEHGLLGGILYLAFLITSFARTHRRTAGREKLICLLWFALALVYEVHSGLKLASQGLLLALACEAFRLSPPPRGLSSRSCYRARWSA